MGRRHAAKRRPAQLDARFGDPVVGKLITAVMLEGKKSVAESIVYDALAYAEKEGNQDPVQLLHEALSNVNPVLEVRSRRVGGATYQVPIPVSAVRSQALGRRWLVHAARDRSEKTMALRLGREIIDAVRKSGAAMKKRETVTKMAEANRAFAHFRW